MEGRKCTWRSTGPSWAERPASLCFVVGFTGLIYSILLYYDGGFIFEWTLADLIFWMGLQLAVFWVMVFSAAEMNFAGRARYRSLTPTERCAEQSGPSNLGLLWGIPIGIHLSVWATLLLLQGATLAKGEVAGSMVCLLPTLAMVLAPMTAGSAALTWGHWGIIYRTGSNITPYGELYGKIAGNDDRL
jgi:hypothetical protein